MLKGLFAWPRPVHVENMPMSQPQKPVRLSGHARQRLTSRGVTEDEVAEAIRTSRRLPAEKGRLECRKDFAFNAEWNGTYYSTKQVRPIFVDNPDEIVVITVYSYYS